MKDSLENTDTQEGFTLRQVARILDGEIVCGQEWADQTVASARGCDLMRDVLAFTTPMSVFELAGRLYEMGVKG